MLAALTQDFDFTGTISVDAPAFLRYHNDTKTAQHVADVAAEARRVALLCGADPEQAETGGWLHDISAAIGKDSYIEFAHAYDVEVLEEEAHFPMIIHQKLSVVMARDIFNVHNPAILSAIGCHTTLKANASLLDKVVFLADKLAWDQPGKAPYYDAMAGALETSLDGAVGVYLSYLWDMRDSLRVVHPWFVDAYQEFLSVKY